MLQGQETYLLKIRVYAVLKFSFSRFKKAGIKKIEFKDLLKRINKCLLI